MPGYPYTVKPQSSSIANPNAEVGEPAQLEVPEQQPREQIELQEQQPRAKSDDIEIQEEQLYVENDEIQSQDLQPESQKEDLDDDLSDNDSIHLYAADTEENPSDIYAKVDKTRKSEF